MLDRLEVYAYGSDGNKVARFDSFRADRLPFKVRQPKGVLELIKVILMQHGTRLDESLDETYRKERLVALAKKYNSLAQYLLPEDLVKVHEYFKVR
jgi:hypothetical protein